MGNVVSSQERRHQVGYGASLPTVRPEQEGAQASFPAGEARLWSARTPGPPCPGPAGLRPALPAQAYSRGDSHPQQGQHS